MNHQSNFQSKFLDIDKTQHRFPEAVSSIGFPVTLLHVHKHAPKNYVLTYRKGFRSAIYLPIQMANRDYYPCAWYLSQDGQSVAYEFSEEKVSFELPEITQRLKTIESLGYQNYGTTAKPVESLLEVETKDGHEYIPKISFSVNPVQTVTDGIKRDLCSVTQQCINQYGSHGSYNVHTYW